MDIEAEIVCPGTETYDGTILSLTNDGVLIRHKKKRSSRFVTRWISAENLLVVVGSQGKTGTVVAKTNTASAFSVDLKSHGKLNGRFISSTTASGSPILLASQYASVTLEESGENKRGPKPKAAGEKTNVVPMKPKRPEAQRPKGKRISSNWA